MNNHLLILTKRYSKLAEFFEVPSKSNNYAVLKAVVESSKTFSNLMFGLKKNPSIICRSTEELTLYELIKKENRFYKHTKAGKFAIEIGERDIRTIDTQKTAEDIIELTHMVDVL
ncbi:MAG: hypothetical protein GTN40_00555 [Candidatus Aenigmarchaeota archaeon]|nr:hypothetical protein [Candidatus Aenigmarchaeota archaeon]